MGSGAGVGEGGLGYGACNISVIGAAAGAAEGVTCAAAPIAITDMQSTNELAIRFVRDLDLGFRDLVLVSDLSSRATIDRPPDRSTPMHVSFRTARFRSRASQG